MYDSVAKFINLTHPSSWIVLHIFQENGYSSYNTVFGLRQGHFIEQCTWIHTSRKPVLTLERLVCLSILGK